jgi:superfamily II DNA or RNA helicase
MSVNINNIINNCSIEQRQKIISDLTIEYQETKFGRKPSFHLFEIDETPFYKNIYVPFSYYYHYLSSLSKKYNINNLKESVIKENKENKEYPKSITNYSFIGNLTEKQELVKEEVFETLNRTKSIILSFHCGFGKTIFSIYITSLLKYKACVLAHRVNLIDQWYYSIKKVCPESKIQILDTKCSIDKTNDFYIINSLNVTKRSKDDFKDIGILIVDEAHTICTENLAKGLFHFQPKYFIGLTATPYRNDGMSIILEHFFGPEIIERKLKRPFNVYVLKTGKNGPVNIESEIKQNKMGDLDWNSVLKSQCLNNKRNKMIVNIIKFFKTRNILVLCKLVEQSKYILSLLKEYGENVDMFVSTQKKFNHDSRILISTFSKTGVGFDHPKLDMLIIASDVEEGIEQYVGRIFRRQDTTPIIIDILDEFRPLYNHYLTRRKLYLETGAEINDYKKYFPYPSY